MTSSYRVHDIAEDKDFLSTRGIIPEKNPITLSSLRIFVHAKAIFLYSNGFSCNLVFIISNGCVINVAINPPTRPEDILTNSDSCVTLLQYGFKFS